MKKVICLFVLVVLLVSCETISKEEKETKLFNDKVFESKYLEKSIYNFVELQSNIRGAKKGYINAEQFITDYNIDYGYILGFSKNLDTIESYLKRKGEFYQKYLIKDAFWYFSTDSLSIDKYKKEKEKLLHIISIK